jgi:hypothetical protein
MCRDLWSCCFLFCHLFATAMQIIRFEPPTRNYQAPRKLRTCKASVPQTPIASICIAVACGFITHFYSTTSTLKAPKPFSKSLKRTSRPAGLFHSCQNFPPYPWVKFPATCDSVVHVFCLMYCLQIRNTLSCSRLQVSNFGRLLSPSSAFGFPRYCYLIADSET